MKICLIILTLAIAAARADSIWRNIEEENKNEPEINFSNEGLFYNPQDEENIEDPCDDLRCGAGKMCLIDEEGKGYCACVDSCYESTDERRKVCSNHNETWDSDCALHRMRCLCEEGSEECKNKRDWAHMHVDYYGVCQVVPKCQQEDMEDFPRRMSEWLFNIMRDMADRRELNDRAMQLEKQAEEDYNLRWTNAAVWKWCQLDHGPRDKAVSRHELFPLRAPLHTLEHCIAPFLDNCDVDGDHMITLKEWTDCLKLSTEYIEELEELCDDIIEA